MGLHHPQYLFVDAANVVNILYHFWGIGRWPSEQNSSAPALLVEKVKQKLNVIRRHCPPESQMVLVLDEHSKRKHDLYPAYKENHRPSRVPVVDVVRQLCAEDSKLRVCVSRNNEADDTIATLCERNKTGTNTVVSCDQDLWQLWESNVSIFNPVKKTYLSLTEVEARYGSGLKPQHVPLAKALWGDNGDHVPVSIWRSRKKLLPLVVKSDGTLEQFTDLVGQSWGELDENLRLYWMLGEDQLRKNYQLVLLDRNCEIIWDREALS